MRLGWFLADTALPPSIVHLSHDQCSLCTLAFLANPKHSTSNYQQVGEEPKIAYNDRQITRLSSMLRSLGLMLGELDSGLAIRNLC
jgi:hypothetical protein